MFTFINCEWVFTLIAFFVIGVLCTFNGMYMRDVQIRVKYDKIYGEGEFDKLLKEIGE